MSSKPNILFITTDQEYAHQAIPEGASLPNRERLKANGVTFVNHHTVHTVCTPSRSAIYTGQHPPHTGMWDNTDFAWISAMSPDIPTIGHMLREQGYYTAYKGKWHESETPKENAQDAMEPYGFSDYQATGDFHGDPHQGYEKDPETATEAAEWLKTKGKEIAARGQPWYLTVNLLNPHDIMYFDTDAEKSVHTRAMFPIFDAPDDEIYEPYWNAALPSSFDDSRHQHPSGVEYYKSYCDQFYGRIPYDRRDLWQNHVNYYVNCMRDVDRHIGTVLDALEESESADNTIVIFTADHGEMAAAHGLRQKGSIAFKEVVNVPCVVVYPGGPKGAVTEAVACHVDIVPTILAWAGVSSEERANKYPKLVGHDLSGVVADPGSDGPRGSSRNPGIGALMTYDMMATVDTQWMLKNAKYLLSFAGHEAEAKGLSAEEIRRLVDEIGKPDMTKRNMYRAMFDGRYKLVRYFALDNYNLPQTVVELLGKNDVGLYDLQSDPAELNNLANRDNPAYDETLLAHMNTKLNALIQAEIGEDKALIRPPSDG